MSLSGPSSPTLTQIMTAPDVGEKLILPHIDFASISHLMQVNQALKNWLQIKQNAVFQLLIQKYFPYLPLTQEKQFAENPKSLFKEEYADYKMSLYKSYQMTRLLATLAGEKSVIGEDPILRTLALSNGHMAFYQEDLVESALYRAIKNKNFIACHQLFLKISTTTLNAFIEQYRYSCSHHVFEFLIAKKFGTCTLSAIEKIVETFHVKTSFTLLRWLLENFSKDFLPQVEKLLLMAVTYKNLTILKWLFDNFSKDISAATLEKALQILIKNLNDPHYFNYLSRHMEITFKHELLLFSQLILEQLNYQLTYKLLEDFTLCMRNYLKGILPSTTALCSFGNSEYMVLIKQGMALLANISPQIYQDKSFQNICKSIEMYNQQEPTLIFSQQPLIMLSLRKTYRQYMRNPTLPNATSNALLATKLNMP